MHIDILSIFPEMFDGPFSHSIIKRAQQKGLASIKLHDIRSYANDKHKRVDDYPYGGGAGMVMMTEPIVKAIDDLKSKIDYDAIVFMTPDGEVFNQGIANRFS